MWKYIPNQGQPGNIFISTIFCTVHVLYLDTYSSRQHYVQSHGLYPDIYSFWQCSVQSMGYIRIHIHIGNILYYPRAISGYIFISAIFCTIPRAISGYIFISATLCTIPRAVSGYIFISAILCTVHVAAKNVLPFYLFQ